MTTAMPIEWNKTGERERERWRGIPLNFMDELPIWNENIKMLLLLVFYAHSEGDTM